VNGKPVKDAAALRNAIGMLSIGDRVDVACCATASRAASPR